MKKEMIKAVRLVNGYNPDLRVRLTAINRDSLWRWLRDNRLGIFGLDFYTAEPAAASDEWDAMNRDLNAAVAAIIEGRGE